MYIQTKIEVNYTIFYGELIRNGRNDLSEFAVRKVYQYYKDLEKQNKDDSMEFKPEEVSLMWKEFTPNDYDSAKNEMEFPFTCVLENGNVLVGLW